MLALAAELKLLLQGRASPRTTEEVNSGMMLQRLEQSSVADLSHEE